MSQEGVNSNNGVGSNGVSLTLRNGKTRAISQAIEARILMAKGGGKRDKGKGKGGYSRGAMVAQPNSEPRENRGTAAADVSPKIPPLDGGA